MYLLESINCSVFVTEREWMFSSRYGDLQPSLQTPLLPRDADPFCLEFSYLINQTGADLVVELVSSQDTNPRHIHLVYEQSDSWISERVTVTPISHHYKVQTLMYWSNCLPWLSFLSFQITEFFTLFPTTISFYVVLFIKLTTNITRNCIDFMEGHVKLIKKSL